MVADKENKKNIDEVAVSSLFKEQFVPISKTLASSILTVPSTTEGLANNNKSFYFFPINSLEFSKNVRNLKNHEATGDVGLAAKILKASLDAISDRLTYLVNESISSGVFPELLKTAKWV